ncbi:LamG domain-containing protein [Curtobacterium sp. 1P10AnD]|uniref:LamG domain-containing protein n=1 Tax=Curtobacterium sp. 1P10AnD TaxID=3132283 RepID=UPI0039A3AA4E
MTALRSLRDGRVVALVLVLAIAAVVLFNAFAPTRSAFGAKITNDTDTAGTAPYFTCSAAVGADTANAVFAYRLGEASGSTVATDWSGKGQNGAYQGSVAAVAPSPNACPRDAGTAYQLNGSTSFVSTPTRYTNPTTFSTEVWFRSTVAGGMLVGFGSNQITTSGQHDRQVYLNTAGQLVFGSYNGTTQVVTSPKAYTDGAWHHVVATMSASTGMKLYADGALVASNAAYTTPENYAGYWRIGYDTVSGWPGQPSNFFFTGQMRYAAVYSTVLSATQVANHATAGR